MCIQINLQKSKAASSGLNNRDNPVVFITEPRVIGRKVGEINRPNTQVLAHDGDHPPRAALRVDRGLHPWLVEDHTDQDQCVVEINVEGRRTYICSLYLDINQSVHRPSFLKLLNVCERDRMPLVIGMDSNAHSPLWGCPDRNERGEDLEEILLTRNLTVMNTGSIPTFYCSRASTIIDLTVMNVFALEQLNLEGWEVLTEQSFSDHRYIQFSLGKYKPKEETYRNLKKADWSNFQRHLDEGNLPTIDKNGSNLDECATALQKLLKTGLDKACPRRKAVARPPNPWWSTDLDKVRGELAVLHSKLRTQSEWEAYQSLRRTYVRMIRKAKRDSWRQFCTKAETVKDLSKIVKILRPKPRMGISLFKSQGRTLSPRETLDNLMDAHFLESTEIDEEESVEAAPKGLRSDNETDDFCKYITPDKVAMSFASFGPLKAAGPDELKPLILQKLTPKLYSYLTELYQVSVRRGYAPKVWREMKVVFLPKSGKTDYGQAKSYRPITLSNFLLKGLERVIQWYINDNIITEPLYAQHAYTVGRSCDSAVSEAVNFIEKNLYRRGQHTLAVSLDCSGAFDRIKFDSAGKAMEDNHIPSSIREWYNNVLENREVSAELQGVSTKRKPMRGSPQGGVLSPLIWILIMNEILSSFKGEAAKVVGYADDILIMVAGKDPGTLVTLMNKALKNVLRWGKRNGLLFNPSKTCVVRFSRAKKFSPIWNTLEMGGTRLEYSSTMKYLGVTLQQQLTWREHAHDRVQKSIKTMNLANAAIGLKWGFNPERALWVYTAMARSVATYSSIVWSPHVNATIKHMLDKLQRKAMLCMTSSMRSTPTAGMEAALGLLPLDLHAHDLGTNARLRNRDTDLNVWDGLGDTGTGHRRYHDNILDTICPRQLPIDSMTRRRVWVDLDDVEKPDVVLYTDGSKMECGTGAGWAACVNDTVVAEDSTYLGSEASVFQAEVLAIEQALRWIIETCDKGTEALIRSDSLSAIQAITSPTTSSRMVHACKQVLRQAKENHRIGIRWIKGHADHTGNELADLLARKGSAMKCDSVGPELPLPMSTIKRSLKAHFMAKWQQRWTHSTKGCRQSKIFFPTVDAGKIKKLAKLTKQNLNLLIQAGTGHALVAYHASKWVEVETTCGLCQEAVETTAHIYYECPVLERIRREIETRTLPIELKIISLFSEAIVTDLFQERSRACNERTPF